METQFQYEEMYRHPFSASLNLTDSCNLACRYCFVEQHPRFMSLEVAIKAVDWLADNYKYHMKNKTLLTQRGLLQKSICFFGGEPMIQYEQIIQPLVAYIEKTYPNEFYLSMTTNGTLLNEEKLKFLSQHNIPIMLSLDGNRDTQEWNRPCQNGQSSFDLVNNNIPNILKYFPRTMMRATVSQDKVDKLFENYLFAQNKNFLHFFAMPDHRSYWPIEKENILKDQLQSIYVHQINSFKAGKKPIECPFITRAIQTIVEHDVHIINNIHMKNSAKNLIRCGLGVTTCSIECDGTITACQEQATHTADIFKIGNLYEDGINSLKQSQLLEFYLNSPTLSSLNQNQCDNCLLDHECINWAECFSTSYDLCNEFTKINPIRCIWLEENLKNAIIMMNILVTEKNALFNEYLIQNVKIYSDLFGNHNCFKEGEK